MWCRSSLQLAVGCVSWDLVQKGSRGLTWINLYLGVTLTACAHLRLQRVSAVECRAMKHLGTNSSQHK
jgi:hypothetical protein